MGLGRSLCQGNPKLAIDLYVGTGAHRFDARGPPHEYGEAPETPACLMHLSEALRRAY